MDELDTAAQRLIDEARLMTEPDLRAPSLLPAWSRAHVLAHLARDADAMRNLLIGARAGRDRPAYASAQARDADIGTSAAAGPAELVDDLASSAMALRTIEQLWAALGNLVTCFSPTECTNFLHRAGYFQSC